MIPNSSASRNWRPKSQGWKGPWGQRDGTGFFRRCLAQDQGDTPAEKHLWRDSIYSEIRRGVQAQGGISIVRMCELAVVSRAGFYRQWEQQEPCEAEMALRDAIQRQALAHRFYGYRRVAVLVQREGYGVGTKKVRRLMQEDNLLALRRRKFVATTEAVLRNNNTSVGRDFIVPLTVEVVPPQVNLRHLRIRDFDPRRISPVINFRMDSQPFPCGGSGNQTDDHFQTGEGLPSPVLADEGEQAVFNLVPFAGPRRKVAHCDGQSGLVGQFLQL